MRFTIFKGSWKAKIKWIIIHIANLCILTYIGSINFYLKWSRQDRRSCILSALVLLASSVPKGWSRGQKARAKAILAGRMLNISSLLFFWTLLSDIKYPFPVAIVKALPVFNTHLWFALSKSILSLEEHFEEEKTCFRPLFQIINSLYIMRLMLSII